ncbi:FxLYD domain-containing protein [Paenibacillus sp. NPDC058174]|uniref:FxLYD domain-containing protein n=1 Tax=Paenibacillus sp. NPDC058174 TaxID=3346366 RepID=UPI0036D87FAC
MSAVFAFLFFVAFVVLLILGIVGVSKKKPKSKRKFLFSAICFIFFISASIATSVQSTDTVVDSSVDNADPDKEAEKEKEKADAKAKADAEAKEKAEAKAKADAEAAKPKLEVLTHSVETDSFAGYIVGTVKNNTKKEYSYVQIQINLYDADGNQVGSALDNTNNLEAGGTWKFKAIALGDDIDSYKIKDVTGW